MSCWIKCASKSKGWYKNTGIQQYTSLYEKFTSMPLTMSLFAYSFQVRFR